MEAVESHPVCVAEETVGDGVAEGGISDGIVPVLDGTCLASRVPRRA